MKQQKRNQNKFVRYFRQMAGKINIGLDPSAANSLDEYLEYRRIVGDDDGGILFTPAEYEVYKKRVIPIRLNNRIYVCWTSVNFGIECKMIGPETKCFCHHRYKQHKTDFEEIPTKRPIPLPCEVKGCACKSYFYVPTNGTQPIRCSCKHFVGDHSVRGTKKCQKPSCSCTGFHSFYTCGCGDPFSQHKMITETKSEREVRGMPVGKNVPYKAMGGLTGFSSLADGFVRLENSGIGAPSKEFLEQPPDKRGMRTFWRYYFAGKWKIKKFNASYNHNATCISLCKCNRRKII